MQGEYSFFAGANSENGFVSFYGSFDSDVECTAVYNIVGGPGTGKSSLLKKASKLSGNNGWICEKYFCSSDPNSLDAIRLISTTDSRKIVMCDATAPHPRELSSPGAVGRLVDLTVYWDRTKLMKEKARIVELQNKKRGSYKSAYRYLKIAGMVLREAVRSRKEQYDMQKLSCALSVYSVCEEGPSVIKRPIRCISMFGEKTLNNKGYSANKKLYIDNQIDCAVILESLLEFKNSAWAAPHPVVNSIFDEVYFPSLDLCVSGVFTDGAKEFNINDYIRKNDEQTNKYLIESYNSYIELAIKSLCVAKDCHFQLEEIYGNAMDFASKEENDLRVMKDVSSLMT